MHGIRVPHMIDFTPDGAYALIAATASGNVSVVRTADRQVVAVLATGPASHAATVRPDGRQAIVAVIGDPKVERDGKLVEIMIAPRQANSSSGAPSSSPKTRFFGRRPIGSRTSARSASSSRRTAVTLT
jgi:DNA-binding beta-propeller fold protein YncE